MPSAVCCFEDLQIRENVGTPRHSLRLLGFSLRVLSSLTRETISSTHGHDSGVTLHFSGE